MGRCLIYWALGLGFFVAPFTLILVLKEVLGDPALCLQNGPAYRQWANWGQWDPPRSLPVIVFTLSVK